MFKKYLLPAYLVVWLILFGWSVARYAQILKGQCNFQSVGWLSCVPPTNTSAAIGLGILYITVFTLFLLAGQRLWKQRGELGNLSPWLRRLLVTVGVAAVFIAPLGTNDFGYYVSAGRTLASGVSPYNANWVFQVDFSSPQVRNVIPGFSYGPLIATLFHGLYKVTGDNAGLFILLWKALMLAALIGCGLLTARLIELVANKTLNRNVWNVFWLAQPLLVFEWVVNGHFDGLWLFFVLLALYGSVTKRWWLVLPALAVGTWIKFIPMLLSPFFVLWWWQEVSRESWKKLVGQMVLGLVAALLITWASWLPYWTGPNVFASLVVQSKWAVTSVFATLYYSLKPVFQSFLGDQAHWYLTRLVQGAIMIAFLYLLYPLIKKCLMVLFKRAQLSNVEFVQYMLVFLLVYLLVWQKSFWPWYATWFISLGLIVYEASRSAVVYKIIAWLATVAFVHHIFLLSDVLSKNPTAGSDLRFYYLVVGTVMCYPLYLLFKWRQKNYTLSEVVVK